MSLAYYVSYVAFTISSVAIFSDEEIAEQDDGVTEKQRFMLSVIAASPPADEDGNFYSKF